MQRLNGLNGLTRRLFAAILAIGLVFGLTACDPTEEKAPKPVGQQVDNEIRQTGFNDLQSKQPAHTMKYSPTRDTKNFWIDTWGKKGKVSYVYLLSNGKPWSFAVLKRLPVTYCTSLVQPTQIQRTDVGGTDGGDSTNVIPAPSIDGTYGSGSNCNSYYGEDATTGAYVEWTAGADTTMLVRDQPLPVNLIDGAIPLGDTTAEQSAKADD